jgi:hypothetical protein
VVRSLLIGSMPTLPQKLQPFEATLELCFPEKAKVSLFQEMFKKA